MIAMNKAATIEVFRTAMLAAFDAQALAVFGELPTYENVARCGAGSADRDLPALFKAVDAQVAILAERYEVELVDTTAPVDATEALKARVQLVAPGFYTERDGGYWYCLTPDGERVAEDFKTRDDARRCLAWLAGDALPEGWTITPANKAACDLDCGQGFPATIWISRSIEDFPGRAEALCQIKAVPIAGGEPNRFQLNDAGKAAVKAARG